MNPVHDRPPDRLSLAGPVDPSGPAVPPALDRAMRDLQDVGLSPSLLERFVSFWKRHGLRKAIVLAVAVTLPLWRFVWIPSAVSGGLATVAEAYGADLEVEDWTSDWTDIAVTGEHVTLHARGPYTEQILLRADSIALDWSFVRGVRNLGRRIVSIFGERPPEEPVHALHVDQATLHFERLLSGRWNWQDALGTQSIDLDGLTRMRLPAVTADQLRLVWVEHLPGESGGGLIEQKTAALYLDDVDLRFFDLMLPDDTRPNATRFSIKGRTGDGTFDANGSMNLVRWAPGPSIVPGPAGPRHAAARETVQWSPTFTVSMYLENIGAAAFSRLTSDASLMPASGTMTGHIRLAVSPEGTIDCELDLQLLNVRYAANPRSSYVQARRVEVEQGVKDLVISQHIAKRCEVPWHEPDVRVVKAIQSEITGEAMHSAPPVLQAAAGYDRLRFVQNDREAIAKFSSDLSAKIGEAIGGERGAAIAKALTASATTKGDGANPVSRGLRSVGRGFKRVFGGGTTDKKKK
jgi:hypothetical protein